MNERDYQSRDERRDRMPEPERRLERLLGLLIAGLMLLNFPLLSIFSVKASVMGMPLLYMYLFGVWAMIIVVTAFVLRRRGNGQKPEGRGASEK